MGKEQETEQEIPLEEIEGIKLEEVPDNKIIRKKIIINECKKEKIEEESPFEKIKKEAEPETRIIRKKIIRRDQKKL